MQHAPGGGTDAVRRIPFTSIQVGTRLPANLYDRHGRIFLRAGRVVEARHLGVAKILFQAGLYVDEKWPEPVEPRTDSESSDSRAHVEDRWVLRSDGQISAASATTRRLDEAIEDGEFASRFPAPSATEGDPPLDLLQLRHDMEAGHARYRASVQQFADVADGLIGGKVKDLSAVRDTLVKLRNSIRADSTLALLALKLKQTPEEYLYHHVVNIATLTMLIATHLGFRDEQIIDAGIGAMFHDLGMLKVPVSIRMSQKPLTPDERLEIMRHPIHSVNVLEQVATLSLTSLIVAYHVHERCDGSGYPRGLQAAANHPLARIAAVADTYVAWSSWRPHRAALGPYKCVVKVLQGARLGWLDRGAVRGLLDCVSLCPVGTYVKLSNGDTARVLRSGGASHTQPIVVPLRADGAEADHIFDLTAEHGITIVAPASRPQNAHAA
jgi:HD-GYP domain-containing protein (c-di-GMP phosphodiesterase class II)